MDREDGGERKDREGGDRQTQRERDMYVYLKGKKYWDENLGLQKRFCT